MLRDKLLELMEEKGINKSELSKGADIPYTTIDGLFKKNSENIKLPTLKKLAAYFNCSRTIWLMMNLIKSPNGAMMQPTGNI